jgi:two-component system phosphate regulon sensor histidine kinase PhoR
LYRRASAEIDRAIRELAETTSSPEQAARVARIGHLVSRWRSETAEPAIAAKKAAIEAARAGAGPPPLSPDDLLREQAGVRMVDEVRREIDAFTEAQRALVAERRAVVDGAVLRMRLVAIAGGAVAVGVAALLLWRLGRRTTESLRELVEVIGRMEAGRLDERCPVRRRDEIGALAEAFNQMAESLEEKRRELLERAGTLQAVLDHVDLGIALLDKDGIVRLSNSRLPKILQVAPFEIEEAGGLLSWVRAQAVRPEAVEAWQRECAKNPSTLVYETVELGPPRNLVLRIFGGPVTGLSSGARILVLRDATREAEADRVKADFISTVSHELRTPLTSVRGYVDLLLAGDAGPISETQREFLGIVARNAERLTTLISDLLDIEKLQSGRIAIKRETVDLRDVLQGVLQTFGVTAKQKGLALEADLGEAPRVLGDPDRLTQVFANLVSNAIKYTREGSVAVRLEAAAGAARVEIKDSGIGIAPEDKPRLFQKFFRAENPHTRSVAGTGLGLAIAKTIVEKHGGSIEVESEQGRGSTFTVVLPAAPAQPVEAAAGKLAASREPARAG